MSREEAKTVFLNRGYVEVEGGTIYDPDKWREACVVISEWLEQESKTEKVIKMRDATPEEQKSVNDYIKSISKPTGIEFDIDIDKKVESYGKLLKHPVVKHIMNEEQEQLNFVQPPVTLTVGGDCISRQQAKAYLYDRIDRLKDNELYDIFSVIIDGMVNELPPVKPQTGHWIMRHRKVNTINYHTGEDVLTGEIHTVKELIRYECDEPYCSECGKRAGDTSGNYCCFCGARMESEQNG